MSFFGPRRPIEPPPSPEELLQRLRPGGRVDVIDGHLTLDVTVGEALVRAQLRGFPLPHTLVEAAYVMDAGPSYAVTAMGPITALRRRFFDLQDHVLGHGEFDERFLVQGRDRDAIARAWSPRALALRLRLPVCELHATHERVTLTRMGTEDTQADFSSFIDLVAELAHAGHDVCKAWAALPGAVPRAASGSRDARVPPGVDLPERSCRVRAVERWRRPVTAVVGWLPRYAPAFAATVLDDGLLDGDPPRGVLPVDAGPWLAAMPGAHLRAADGALTIVFPTLTAELAPLDAATRLCHAAATAASARR